MTFNNFIQCVSPFILSIITNIGNVRYPNMIEVGGPEMRIKLNGTGRTLVRKYDKVGRNDTCPCGSGTKYKHCHG